MKVRDARAFYFDYAKKLDDRIRTLAITGIAIIWVFKQTTDAGFKVPQQLVTPGVLLITALALDVLQLAYGMIAWGKMAKRGAGKEPDYDIEKPAWLNWPTMFMAYSRMLFVFAAYVLLIKHMTSTLM